MLLITFDDNDARSELIVQKHNAKFKNKKGYNILVAEPSNIPFILSVLLKDYPEKLEKAKEVIIGMGGKFDFPNEEEKQKLIALLQKDSIVALFDINWEDWYDDNYWLGGLHIAELLHKIVPLGFHTRYDVKDVNEKAPKIGNFYLKTEDAQDIDKVLEAVEDGFYNYEKDEKVKYDMFLMSDSDWAKRLSQGKGLDKVEEKNVYLSTIVLRNPSLGIWRYVALEDILFISSDRNRSYLALKSNTEGFTINCNIGNIEKQFQPFWETNQPNPFWHLQRIGNQIVNLKHIDYRDREYLYFKNTTQHIDISANDGVELDKFMLVLKMRAS